MLIEFPYDYANSLAFFQQGSSEKRPLAVTARRYPKAGSPLTNSQELVERTSEVSLHSNTLYEGRRPQESLHVLLSSKLFI